MRNFPLTAESDYWRAVTAVRRAEGRNTESEDAYRRASALLSKKPITGTWNFEREFLEVHKGNWVSRSESCAEIA